MGDMSVIILCGGKGTRMWPSTKEIPKPMAEIGGKPLLWHLMKMYAHHGFTDFILLSSATITSFFRSSFVYPHTFAQVLV